MISAPFPPGNSDLLTTDRPRSNAVDYPCRSSCLPLGKPFSVPHRTLGILVRDNPDDFWDHPDGVLVLPPPPPPFSKYTFFLLTLK